MSFEVYVYMVGSASAPSAAVIEMLKRLYPLGVQLEGVLREAGEEDQIVAGRTDPWTDGWEAKVDAWRATSFSVVKARPMIQVSLRKLTGKALRARVGVSGRSLEHLFLNGRQHDPNFYAPLFQIALALGVRAGVGDLELEEFEPKSEKDVEQAIWRDPREPESPCRLGFLRRDPGLPKPAGDFVVTERPEGYWLLEHPSFLKFLGG